jgi:hypothetical protein
MMVNNEAMTLMAAIIPPERPLEPSWEFNDDEEWDVDVGIVFTGPVATTDVPNPCPVISKRVSICTLSGKPRHRIQEQCCGTYRPWLLG